MSTSFSARGLVRSFFRSIFWSINIGLALYTLLTYWLLYSLTIEHWSASMLMISLPVAWVGNIAFVLIWAVYRSWRSLLSGLVLLSGFWLGPRTFAWHLSEPIASNETSLTVFSYNVMGFNVTDRQKRDSSQTLAMTKWVVDLPTDVKCFQEFQNYRGWAPLQMVNRLHEAGYSYQVLMNKNDNDYPGTALFSRYPILQSGRESFGQEMNGLVWADIRVKNQTIRLINIHLQSMGIRVGKVIRQNEMAGVRHETKGILGALKSGFVDRRDQLEIIERYINESPHPVIITGDFNETPYSVVYTRLRRKLRNAFEDAGHGFGFTLNRMPKLIRIDNQFYDPRIKVLDFQTLRNVPYSDHYPILGKYAINVGAF